MMNDKENNKDPSPETPPFKVIVEHKEKHSRTDALERVAKIAALLSALVAACFGTCTFQSAITKFEAEAESARLQAVKTMVEVAGRPGEGDLALNAVPMFAATHPGVYIATASLKFRNTGFETIIVEHVRFACASRPLDLVHRM